MHFCFQYGNASFLSFLRVFLPFLLTVSAFDDGFILGLQVLARGVRSFIRLRIRARCSVLSNRSGVPHLISGTVGSNVGNVTMASRNIVFNVGRLISCYKGIGGSHGGRKLRPFGPVVNYRVCITQHAGNSHRGSGNSVDNCRLVILTGGCGKCGGLVGLIDGS